MLFFILSEINCRSSLFRPIIYTNNEVEITEDNIVLISLIISLSILI